MTLGRKVEVERNCQKRETSADSDVVAHVLPELIDGEGYGEEEDDDGEGPYLTLLEGDRRQQEEAEDYQERGNTTTYLPSRR